MLWAVVTCAFLSSIVRSSTDCPDAGKVMAKANSGTNNYVVDLFTGELYFAYAIDQCTSISLLGGKSFKYQCVQGTNNSWTVTKTAYSSSSCSGTGTVEQTFSAGNDQGAIGYFVCDGDNTYAKVELSTASDCSFSQIVYAGLGSCTLNKPLLSEFYCESTYGLVQFFLNSTFYELEELEAAPSTLPAYEICDSALLCSHWYLSTSCGLIAQNVPPSGITIYGQLDSCMASTSTATTSTTSTSSSSNNKAAYLPSFSLLNIVFGLFVTLFLLR
jgi:hypothetical protein